jgi:hypothetical protein
MPYRILATLSLIFIVFILFHLGCLDAQDTESSPTATASTSSHFDSFPAGLVCSEAESGLGPTWRNITIGESSLSDIETQYGESFEWNDMLRISDFDYGWDIFLCVKDDVITAIKVGSELAYLEDYLALYGEPDAVTWSDDVSRVVFWFDEGIAVDIYVNTTVPDYYGTVSYVIYFPYQDMEGYETRWPYQETLSEAIPDERNPLILMRCLRLSQQSLPLVQARLLPLHQRQE